MDKSCKHGDVNCDICELKLNWYRDDLIPVFDMVDGKLQQVETHYPEQWSATTHHRNEDGCRSSTVSLKQDGSYFVHCDFTKVYHFIKINNNTINDQKPLKKKLELIEEWYFKEGVKLENL